MNIPRIDTIITKHNTMQNSKQMRIPTDLGKPVHFQANNPNCNKPCPKLNIIA